MRGYPQPLVEAHEHARLGGVEIEILEGLLMEKIRERDPATADYARQLRLMGQQLAQTNPRIEANES